MLLNDSIEGITFQTIVDFCLLNHEEGQVLDYKEDFPRNLAKSIAAMANTLGGHIIIGVKDDDGKPAPPFVGMDYLTGLATRVHTIVSSSITPPVIVQTKVCPNSQGDKCFVYIRIPESGATPHVLLGPNKGIYVRTGDRSVPEDIVSPDQLSWLHNMRQRSEELRTLICKNAEERFKRFLELKQIVRYPELPPCPLIRLSILPTYPIQELFDFSNVHSLAEKVKVRTTFVSQFPAEDSISVKIPGGLAFTQSTMLQIPGGENNIAYANQANGKLDYVELTNFGHLFWRRNLFQNSEIMYLWIAQMITQFLSSAALLYKELGYYGLLEFLCEFENLTQKVVHLPENFTAAANASQLIPNEFVLHKRIAPSELQESSKILSLCIALLNEIAWGLGIDNADSSFHKRIIQNNQMIPRILSEPEFYLIDLPMPDIPPDQT